MAVIAPRPACTHHSNDPRQRPPVTKTVTVTDSVTQNGRRSTTASADALLNHSAIDERRDGGDMPSASAVFGSV
jgi:hypothetical protein